MAIRRYFFAFGRNDAISAAELAAVLKQLHITYTPTPLAREGVLIETESEIANPQALLDRLGGTVKMCTMDHVAPLQSELWSALQALLGSADLMRAYAHGTSGRWTFGISVYGAGHANKRDEVRDAIHKAGLTLKNYLKSQKRSARFVAVRGVGQALSSVAVRGNDLLSNRGAEIVLLVTDRQLFRGRTVAVQDYDAYSLRDYGRPARDPRTGSLPPKLAQILLNLARLPQGAAVHDPFVGIGTLLQEGALLGLHMTGSDLDLGQVERTRANLAWLVGHVSSPNLATLHPVRAVAVADARTFPCPTKLAGLVTEGTLGPALHGRPSAKQADTTLAQIAALWREVLTHAKTCLGPDGVIVATWPQFVDTQGQLHTLPLLDELASLGYRLDASLTPRWGGQASARGTLTYARPDQFVQREIVRLTSI